MNNNGLPGNGSWWSYPFKPVKVDIGIFKRINPKNYSLESKFDGFRAIVIANGTTELWTREKRRIELPDNLAEQLRDLNLPRGTVLDGEIWNPTKRGGWKQTKDASCRLTLWDAIQVGSTNLSLQPIEKRREALYSLMRPGCPHIQAVEVQAATPENCELARLQANQMRDSLSSRSGFIHGVVLKRNGSPRHDHACRSTEHPNWLKIVFDKLSGWAPR